MGLYKLTCNLTAMMITGAATSKICQVKKHKTLELIYAFSVAQILKDTVNGRSRSMMLKSDDTCIIELLLAA